LNTETNYINVPFSSSLSYIQNIPGRDNKILMKRKQMRASRYWNKILVFAILVALWNSAQPAAILALIIPFWLNTNTLWWND